MTTRALRTAYDLGLGIALLLGSFPGLAANEMPAQPATPEEPPQIHVLPPPKLELELARTPADGRLVPQGSVKIGSLSPGGSILTYLISPDATRVVFNRRQGAIEINEVFSVPISGGVPTLLNGPLTASGNVNGFAISPDSTTVVYLADQTADEVYELYSVSITGGPATKISGVFVPQGDPSLFRISGDSTRVVYVADADTNDVSELYSVPITGGPVTKLSGPFVTGGDVFPGGSAVQITADSSRVIYLADQVADNVDELFSVPIAGGVVTKLNPTLVANGDVGSFATIDSRTYYSADQDVDNVTELYSVANAGGAVVQLNGPFVVGGNLFSSGFGENLVLYVADQDVNNVFNLYAVPTTGGVPIQLNPPLVPGGNVFGSPRIPDQDMTAVYSADQDTDGVVELYSVPTTGGASTKLNPPLVAGGGILGFGTTVREYGDRPARVVYFAEQDADNVIDLYGVPMSGGVSTKLNGPLVTGGDLVEATFSANGVVVYRADEDVDNVNEIFSRTTTGVGPVTKLNPSLPAGRTVASYALANPPTHIVYRADQDTDNLFELYSTAIVTDADGDAVLDPHDCLAYDATLWEVPGEVTGLTLFHSGGVGGTTVLSWSAPASPGSTSPGYDTVRSPVASDFVTSATCVETDDGTDTTAVDNSTPLSGDVAFFLVRAKNDCGSGTVGVTSDATLRTARACP